LPAVLSVCTNTAWPASLASAGLDALAKAGVAAVATAAAATAAAAVTRIAVLTETPHAWGSVLSPLQYRLGSFRYAASVTATSGAGSCNVGQLAWTMS
jgi:glycine cleavage system pyridoxal-binding protein P